MAAVAFGRLWHMRLNKIMKMKLSKQAEKRSVALEQKLNRITKDAARETKAAMPTNAVLYATFLFIEDFRQDICKTPDLNCQVSCLL